MTDTSSPFTSPHASASTEGYWPPDDPRPEAPNVKLPPLEIGTRGPEDYHWVPVLKKPRKDGWSHARQRGFIEALADTGSVTEAARIVGMTVRSAQKLRRSPGAEGFDQAWAAAIHAASKKLLDEAFERALIGKEEAVFDRDGRHVGHRYRKSDNMLQFMLRGYFPQRFGHFGHIEPGLDEDVPPDAVAEAIERLTSPTPESPHRLMTPDELEDAVLCADILDGVLPRRYQDPEPEPEPRFDDVDADRAA